LLTKILLRIGALSNLATLIGFWMTFIASPESVQMRVSRLLLFSGALLSVLVYIGIVLFIFRRPKGERRKSVLEAFRNPQWETVSGHRFMNESVDLDGRRFVDCTFQHVKLVFHGRAPTEFLARCHFGPNIILSTGCQPAVEYAKLIHIFSNLPNTTVRSVLVDAHGKEVPPNFEITEITPKEDKGK
jgi:hypothetical protein